MYLAQWARDHGVPYSTAYRWFRHEQLPPGVQAWRTRTGSIQVAVDTNPLSDLDPHQMATWLRQAGYYLLTVEQAHALGLDNTPTTTRKDQ